MKRALACALALAVVLLSPGLQCYAGISEIADPGGEAQGALNVALPGTDFSATASPGADFSGLNSTLDFSVLPGNFPATTGAEDSGAKETASRAAETTQSSPVAPIGTTVMETAPAAPTPSFENTEASPASDASSDISNEAVEQPAAEEGIFRQVRKHPHPGLDARNRAAGFNFARVQRQILLETKPWQTSENSRVAAMTEAQMPVLDHGAELSAPELRASAVVAAPKSVPSAELPPSAPAGGIFQRARAWVSRLYHIFPDKARNKQFWLYNLAQVVITQGAMFYSTELPEFVAPTKALSGRMGVIRAASFSSQLSADVLMGPSVDKKPTSTFLFRTYFVRGALLGLIPLLYFSFFHSASLFPTLPLIAILVGMSFVQSAGILASEVGFNRLLGDDSTYYNKANAASELIVSMAGVISPALAGAFIAWADKSFGAAGGSLAFGIFGIASVVTALIYRTLTLVNLQPSVNPAVKTRPATWALRALIKFTAAFKAALTDVKKAAGTLLRSPSEFWKTYFLDGIKQKAGVLGEVKKGFQLVWHDRFLRLSLVFSTAALIIGDAISILALPRYIEKAGAVVLPAFLAHAPLIGGWLTGYLANAAAILGLFFAASNFGPMVFDMIFMSRQTKTTAVQAMGPGVSAAPAPMGVKSRVAAWALAIKNAVENWVEKKLSASLTPLQKQGVWSSFLCAVGWIACLLTFLTPHIWLALGAFTLSAFLQSPAVMVWQSLEQRVLNDNYAKDQAKLWSAMSVYSQIFTIIGDLFFGVVMMKFSTTLALGVVMAALGVCAVLEFVAPLVIFRKAPPPGRLKA